MSLSEIGFLVAAGEKVRGRPGVGRKPPTERVVERGRELMRARLVEYTAMDAVKTTEGATAHGC